jgi:protein involved in polysaccharide export with SLBB domain
MIRIFSRGLIAAVLVCFTGFGGALAADLFGSGAGFFGTAPSDGRGTANYSLGGYSPYPTAGGYSDSSPEGMFFYPMMRGGEPAAAPGGSAETRAPQALQPLPPEGQSAFEQFVSGKIEITPSQLNAIVGDSDILFRKSLADVPPGAFAVPVRVVPPLPGGSDNVAAGYLAGRRERIVESFRLLGISTPYSVSMDLKHFGLDMFQSGRYGFLASTPLPVGPDYILGPEDELKIRVWGKVEGHWSRRIGRDGTIHLPKVGVVSLGGLTLAQAAEALRKEFERVFTGFEMNVTMGALRTMTVYVVGHVRQPGAYTVSSLATLIHALIQAGGPSKSGSMRDIQIRREGFTAARYDLYDLLRSGDKSGDPKLLPEDVIFVPPIGPVAAIAGSVNRPGLYELRGERTVSELIGLAGGLNAVAFRGRLQIERIVESNRQIVFESDLAGSGEKEVDLRSGDILTVYQVVQDRRTVRVGGAVHREGEYGFSEGMTVKDLLSLAGGTRHYAFLKEAELGRRHLSQEGIRVEKRNIDLERALAGDPGANLPLQEGDVLFIRSIPEWKPFAQVTIQGEVRFPGTYTARKGERLSSLIERAGGFTHDAYVRGAVFRRVSVREAQQKVLDESVARLERDLMAQGAADISVAASSEELSARTAEVQRVQALVAKLRAAKVQGRVVLEISHPDKMRNTRDDIELEDGDDLFIPRNPRSIHTLGAVFNQATFVYDERKDLEDYIEMAGGYQETADKDRIYILKVNGSAVRPESGFFLFSGSAFSSRDGRPLLESGDTIIVPEKIGRIAWLRNTRDISQILFQAVMAAGVVIAAL